MRSYILLCITWSALALITLYLVIEDNSSLFAALVAWCGGIVTYRLVQRGWQLYRSGV